MMFATDKNDDGHLNHGLQARVEKTAMTASVKCSLSSPANAVASCCDHDGLLLMPLLAWSSSLVSVNE